MGFGTMKNSRFDIHFIFILIAAGLWGTAGIFVRTAGEYDISQMQLVFGRAVLTALLIGLIMLFKNRADFKIKLKDIWLFIAAGLFSIVLFNYSYYTTMSVASLSVAAVLLYTAPFFVVFISRFLFGIALTVEKLVACLVAFVGCCFVSGLFDSAHRISGTALFFGLLTGFGYALYTVFGELLLKRGYGTLTITFYVFLFAGICTIPFIDVTKTVKYVTSDFSVLAVLFLMALLNTVIPYIFYTTGLKGVDPSIAPIIATIEPVVATVVGAVCFSERITIMGAIGIILVLVSVVILNMKSITVTANAKINLILSINGKREDGYHFIDTVMQSVSLGDKIKIKPSKEIKIKCNIKELENSDNIAFKAAELFFRESGISGGATIKITKRIPLAAGIGGGSADAAAVLLALNRLYDTNFSEEQLEAMALCLGADVPFFIRGGTKRAEGIGERLTVTKGFETGYFLLAKGDKKPSTAEMYKRLDNENPKALDTESFIALLNEGDYGKAARLMDNSFRSVWKNNSVEEKLKALEPAKVSLSGSGPTCFAYFLDKKAALKALKSLKKEKIEAYLVKPLDKSVIFE